MASIIRQNDVKYCWYVFDRPQIAERGTQDFSTRLIKHTELGKRVLRAGIKALAITKTFSNIRVTRCMRSLPPCTANSLLTSERCPKSQQCSDRCLLPFAHVRRRAVAPSSRHWDFTVFPKRLASVFPFKEIKEIHKFNSFLPVAMLYYIPCIQGICEFE